MLQNTICAVATPPGEGGISVIRVSGDEALRLLQEVFQPKKKTTPFVPTPRYLYLGQVRDRDGLPLDQALAVYMPAPHSYTGEDVVEIQCHGGYVVTREILKALLAAGAVPAEPGEFTQRAFLNGRINLTQAEAIIDIIQAKSTAALELSEKQLDGALGQAVLAINDRLLDLLAQIEVAVDYPEEEADIWEQLRLSEHLEECLRKVRTLLRGAEDGRIYRDGLLTTIVGPANAGKSTLLNALLREERAIVTEIAGTTRDTIEEYYHINGLPVRLVDTAGIRETADPVEAAGVRRSREKLAAADLALLVWDIRRPLAEDWRRLLAAQGEKPLILLLNKGDLLTAAERETAAADWRRLFPKRQVLLLSARENRGVEELRRAIYETATMGRLQPSDLQGLVNERQKSALLRAEQHLEDALRGAASGIDGSMVAIDIQSAWEALAEITGGVTSDEIIDRVFSRFCLGK